MITIFNYDLEKINKLMLDNSALKSYAYQEEISPTTKKLHIQAYLEFKNPRTLGGVKKFFKDKTIHVEFRKGSKQDCIKYCTKEDTRVPDTSPHMYNVDVKAGSKITFNSKLLDYYQSKITETQMILLYPNQFVRGLSKYRSAKEALRQEKEIQRRYKQYSEATLRPWQKACLNLYLAQSSRKILWIYDRIGNTGKSWMVEYIAATQSQTYIVNNGRVSDIFYAYKLQDKIIYDLSRTQTENMQHLYNTMEKFKNGRAFSGKYESISLVFTPCKVLVFSNFPPELDKLSYDRWDIYQIKNNSLVKKKVNKQYINHLDDDN